MAVDEETKKKDELELYQIDDKAIVPFFRDHLEDLKRFLHEHKEQNLSLLVMLKQFIRTYRMPFNMQRYMEVSEYPERISSLQYLRAKFQDVRE